MELLMKNTSINVQRSFVKKLIFFQIYYNLFIKFFIGEFNFPHSLNYITDIVTFFIVLFALGEIKHGYQKNKVIYNWLIIMILFTFIGFIWNIYSPLYYLWGLRNTFRFFIFFLCCAVILNKSDVQKIIKLLLKLLPLNVLLCAYQYYTLRDTGGYVSLYLGDFIGGIFGPIQGSNVPMNIYLSLILTFIFVAYTERQLSLFKLLIFSIMCFYIAILAELKFIYFEFLLILLLLMVLSKISFKKILSFATGVIIIVVVLNIWTMFNPDSSELLSNTDAMINYSANESYAGKSSVNRLSAIPTIVDVFFQYDISKKLVGVGLGNADTSTISFLSSPMYDQYGEKLKYNFFQQAILLLETGFVGLILYILFFIIVFINTFKVEYLSNYEYIYIVLARIFAILAILNVFYNQSFRLESSGYLSFLMLSIPFIWKNNRNEELTENT
jgi:hypothetical protein